MKKNIKKVILAGIVIIAILLVILIIKVVNLNNTNKNEEVISSKKIQKYISLLTGDYYMQYTQLVDIDSDEDGEADSTQEMLVEFEIMGTRMVKNLPDEGVRFVIEEDAYYYVMDTQKMILYYPLDETAITEYKKYLSGISPQSFEDSFLSTGTEKIDEELYYYEEYDTKVGDGSTYRYYFNDKDELVYMRTISPEENVLVRILQLNNNINAELFKVPSTYTIYNGVGSGEETETPEE